MSRVKAIGYTAHRSVSRVKAIGYTAHNDFIEIQHTAAIWANEYRPVCVCVYLCVYVCVCICLCEGESREILENQ